MAHLLRLTLALVALLLGSLAHAAITPGTEYRVAQHTYGDWSSSMEAACAAWGAETVARNEGFTLIYTKVVEGACEVRGNFRYSQPASSTSTISSRSGSCPVNSTASNGSCVCSAGFSESGGACVAKEDPEGASAFCRGMGAVKAGWKQTGKSTGGTPSTSCYMPYPPFTGPDASKGCVTTINDSVAVPNADGSRTWSATGVATGATCTEGGTSEGGTGTGGPGGTGNGQNPPTAAPNPCPNGFPGTVNGMSVCAAPVPDNGVDSTVRSSSTGPDGTRSDVVEETKCAGGTCVTNTTVNNYNSAGAPTGSNTSSSTQPIKSLCAKNPGNSVCSATGLAPTGNTGTGTGNTGTGTGSGGTGSGTGSGGSGSGSGGGGDGSDSSFSGTCAAGFKAVSEDAVINAMAEETFRQNCKVNPDADSQKEGKAAYDANEKPVNMTKDNPNNGDVKIGPGDFDTSNAIGGGGCIADKAVMVAGKSITLPLSSVCPYLEMLGSVLLACSFLLAARIVTRG